MGIMIPRINFRRADEWVIVDIKDASDYIKVEIIHVPTTDDIYVCLVNIGSGTPIISTLELRPLNNSIYDKSEPGSLLLFNGWDFSVTYGGYGTYR